MYERCGLEVADGAGADGTSHVLNDDEKELGVCLVDIGGGTTDLTIFTEGQFAHGGDWGCG